LQEHHTELNKKARSTDARYLDSS